MTKAFLKHYKPEKKNFTLKMPAYTLPLDFAKVSNLKDLERTYLTNARCKELLGKNGFVVYKGGPQEDITAPYREIIDRKVPIYVTADTPLHLFHVQFDETLKNMEEKVFYPEIMDVTRALLAQSEKDYTALTGDLREAAKRNVAYFSVAMCQFDPAFRPPSSVREVVEWECKNIEEHKGPAEYADAQAHALMRVPEDYSQYKPRGHYTRSETLKKYFRGMMWFGRMTFLLKGNEICGPLIPPARALVNRQNAKIQTIQASLISEYCGTLTLGGGKKITDAWDRIYAVTAFYVGFSDDLTIYDYRDCLRKVFGSTLSPGDLEGEEKYARLVLELAKLKGPAIFSGTGNAGIDLNEFDAKKPASVKELDRVLDATMGFRFMGQRYIPDSYILGELVSPAVGMLPGEIPDRFTVTYLKDRQTGKTLYSARGVPMGLDVFSVLGSRRAEEHIRQGKNDEWPGYAPQIKRLRAEFASLKPEDWNRNLYWSWLYALKSLVAERGEGYQTYQRQDAWLDRQLDTALSSWAALRHDTILYAKQSYTMRMEVTTCVRAPVIPTPPPPPKGIVEPLPEFYAKMLTTARMAHAGLKELGVLDAQSEMRILSLVKTLERLNEICIRQVENTPLTEADNLFLGSFPVALKGAIGEVDEKGLKTTIIGDVHTDVNSGQVLEEASGYVDYIIVAYARPEGDIVLAAGPVLSYYEFRHPMADRLTDEKWRDMLRSSPPPRPEWIKSYFQDV
ncbi:MAG: DUF3160 domain-containing protein [Candidatus Eremiobacteraeota bacterium]|nr:DUF3160 domain-containing protein [Candidatus Eremiobacteraeota bacterium]